LELLGLLVPFLAAGGWLWFIHHSDRVEKEPWGLVFKTFGLGASAGLVGLVVWFVLLLRAEGLSANSALILAPVHVGGILLALRLLPYRRPEWNEPFDGIVYGGAAGIGYGLVYTLVSLLEGPLVGFRTGIFSIPIYMLAGLVIGHYMSQVRFGAQRKPVRIWLKGLLIPSLYLAGIELTRAWGGTVVGEEHPLASVVAYAANTVGWIMAMWAMDAKTRVSQYHPQDQLLKLAGMGCPECATEYTVGAAFCNGCGRPVVVDQGVQA
jgi:hypothetical protein